MRGDAPILLGRTESASRDAWTFRPVSEYCVQVNGSSDDPPEWARPVWATCEALAVLLAPHGEVALHDLGTGRIAGLWNPLSGRAVGEESLIARPQDLDATSMGPYPATLPDGRQVSCVSAVVPDAAGVPRGLLCVNVDRSPLDRIVALAGGWLAPTREQPAELFQQD